MTAIIDRDVITALQSASEQAAAPARRTAGAPHRRTATRARGVSPRLARSRGAAARDLSTTVSNATAELDLRTAPEAPRVVGARGAATRTVERPRVRPNVRRLPRGASREGGCARRGPRSTMLACVLAAAGTFVGLVILFGGAAEPAPQGAPPSHSALTSIVTVRAGQDLQQIAREIAPNRPATTVAGEIAEMNGLKDSTVRAGQSLVTPRY